MVTPFGFGTESFILIFYLLSVSPSYFFLRINIKKPGVEELQASHKEKHGGEVQESAIKKFKTNSGKKINITMDLDLNSITSSKPSTSPVNRGSLLKPTTTLSQNNAAPVKTLSLSDYKKRKS